jgi:hypothetical protein
MQLDPNQAEQIIHTRKWEAKLHPAYSRLAISCTEIPTVHKTIHKENAAIYS